MIVYNMKKILSLSLLIIILSSCSIKNNHSEFNIIPKPNQIEYQKGSFAFNDKVFIKNQLSDCNFVKSINIFQKLFYAKTKIKLKTTSEEKKAKPIILKIDANLLDEQYHLNISKSEIIIEGGSKSGVFYGLMSLYQIVEKKGGLYIAQSAIINDKPAFQWRGMHLDVSRHFYTVKEVKKLISAMALLKLNVFHWHLTDDQGWRIEIKKYPKLTTIGSKRKETLKNHAANWPETFDGKEESGFYTQEEIKDVVAFAAAHQMTIVPEIEMPGHAVAALAAYPQFACTKGPFEVWGKWGVNPEVFCAGKEETYHFLEDILDEVCELFPGEIIHIGGDECPKTRWEHCKDCQQKVKEENLNNIEELQGYFTTRMEAYLFSKGKRTVGWDEILDGGAPPRAIIMSWRGEEGGIAAAKAGNDVVMAPNAYVYFDHYQDLLYEPLAIGGLTRMQEVYDFNPFPKELTSGHEHILGAQAQLWTEYIIGNKHLEYMIFPRLLALSEALWTSQPNKDYPNFQKRLSYWYSNLDLLKLNYRIDYPHGYNLINKSLDDVFEVKLSSENSKAKIYYTIDGFEPDSHAMRYTKPIKLNMPEDSILKSIAILPNGKKSKVHQGVFQQVVLNRALQLNNVQKGLKYQYYKGEFKSATSLNSDSKSKNGIINSIRIPDENDGVFFGLIYSGYINVPEDELYTFYLNSDDGSILSIDGQQIIDNDGFHYDFEKSGQIGLKTGYHSIEVKYFQAKYGAGIKLDYSTKKVSKTTVPSIWYAF